ncbi:hypothetical protein CMI47_02660 [Candidatus Pacearchaeota archaeon]|jgi:hypothetical protein|nr:hypothetical protein [Candidatus Pacearchaeota archaeon]|tara:strand:+ start:3426 stop:4538 length:1113 start_codon:yes stop_codon:yes gene_type:complete
MNHKELTQYYSSWGDKLLQHTDVLYDIQKNKKFRPINIQLCPCEVCESDCPFCSVAGRPLRSYIPFNDIIQILTDFKSLGTKSIEITGGGNPMLYRDKETKKNINDIIRVSHDLELNIGLITNSHDYSKLDDDVIDMIDWIRVSLIKLDEGKLPKDYNFGKIPYSKLAFSYIIYDGQMDENNKYIADELSRTNKVYNGTTSETIEKIVELVELHSKIKFVRIAGNCLIKGNNALIREKYKDIIDKVDKYDKFFIKDIGYNDGAFEHGCYVGLIRPYIAPSPHGGDYQVYICTSHVLNTRIYDLDWSLGGTKDIIKIWKDANEKFKKSGFPYEVKNNKGKEWNKSCNYCYYKFNNKLLHTVANEMPDKNFP